MAINELFDDMKTALVEFEVDSLKEMVRGALDKGVRAEEIIDVLSEGMDIVGEKYQEGEYFVTSLIIAGETMKEALDVLEPHLSGQGGAKRGKIVVATVAGDIHDIGKNIFMTLMDTAGFDVIDLGVDVSADAIVGAVKEHDPDILGLSALLTTNLEQFPLIVEMLWKEGLRSHVKIIVGGATITEEFARGAGVDAHAKTAVEGVNICKAWTEGS
ncbi:MAG: cobalamin-dependent protein [Candidatus Bathyarchaeota archaeon]|nr:MAG: cobalamin-dependent protein [Candidatus Bathyarchaeota archaeon]